MFGTLLSWIASGGLSGITRALQQAYEAKLRAQTDADKLATDLKIRELESRRDVILAAQSDRVERWVRVAFAAPFAIYNAKLLIWDKTLGWGATDPLSPMLTEVFWIVLGGFFLVSVAKVIRK